ncbi:MAG: hypothetical protein DHS20C21_11720 [Gemmatimonadota bacterium]|nr:MAG: hypothetical protein DHS20C21_11720 [Gemmatimonadota bacterium]
MSLPRLSSRLRLFLPLAAGLLLTTSARAAVTFSGTISSDTTWSNSPDPIVNVTNTVTINPGVTLTIEPGVTVKMALNRDFTVNGTLNAIGGTTADSTIYFTSIRDDNLPPPGGDDTNGDGNVTAPANSDWGNIHFTATGGGTLENCEVWFGGWSSEGSVVCTGSSPSIIDCDINAGYYGIQCLSGAAPTISGTDVSACTSVPVAISIDSNPVLSSVTFASTSDNGFDAIGILSTTLTGANSLPVRGTTIGGSPIPNITYLLLGDITIAPAATLNVDAGVIVKCLNTSTDIHVSGTLNAIGTAAADSQIVFTSFKDDNRGDPADTNNDGSTTAPSSGDWGGIVFAPGSGGLLDYCAVQYGGYSTNNSCVYMDNVGSAVTISNSEIGDSSYGIEVRGVSDPTLTNNVVSNCANTPVLMSVSANPTFSGNSFVTNGVTALGLLNETVNVDSQIFKRTVAGFTNITYVLIGNLTMDVGTVLTVDPGVVVKMRTGSTVLNINGGLQAIGAPADSIVFTSWKDDVHGNPADTNGDGSATVPAHSDWGWIKFLPTAIDSVSNLDYCFLGYGGWVNSQPWNGTIWCNSSSPTITNCNFWNDRIGVRVDGTSSATITGNNFFNSLSVPIHISATSTPTISGNSYSDNGFHALGLISETLASSATLSVPTAGVAQFGTPFTYFLAQGAITVGGGSVLTIDPDVIVKFDSYGINIAGGLVAEDLGGSNPIVFTDIKDDSHGGDSNVNSNSNGPGNSDWPGLTFQDASDDANCRLIGCEFWYGGSSTPKAPVRIEQANTTVDDCSFEFNNHGIWVQGIASPSITNNLIRQSSSMPIVIDILSSPTFSGNVFDSNGITALGYVGGTLAQDGTIPVRNLAGFTNITNVLDSNLTVLFGANLTIDPGVVLKAWDGASPFWAVGGSITVSGGLIMDGTPGNRIVITSVEDDTVGNPLDTNGDGALTTPAPDDWNYVRFLDVSDDGVSVLDYVDLRYGGASSLGSVSIDSASPTISNCTFQDSNLEGIGITGVSNPIVSSCAFTRCTRTPVALSLLSNPVFSGNTLNDNFYSALGVYGETLAQDVTWARRAFAGDPRREYILITSMTVGTGANLTIDRGVTIKPLSGVDLNVRRGIFANGGAEPESLIVFTSPRDDFYGGDTNGDSTDTDGFSLRWGHIKIEPTALSSSVQFSNCVFAYGSTNASEGAVTVQGSVSPSFTDCLFSHGTNGINYTQASGNPAVGVVTGCDFFDHSGFAIENTGLAHIVSAQNCWWGDDTGPLDASDDTGTGGWYNPGGLGDAITNLVNYTPWQGMGLGNFHVGDVSLNGELHAFDAALLFRWLVPDTTLSAQQQVLADVTCDGSPTAFDAALILQYVADLIVTFPCLEKAEPLALGEASLDGRNARAAGARPTANPATALRGLENGEYKVSLPDFALRPGTTVRLPLLFEGAGEAFATQFLIRPESSDLRILSIEPGAVAEGTHFYSGIRPDGSARIAMGSIHELTRGVVAVLEVEILGDGVSTESARLAFTEALINEQNVLGSASDAQGQIDTALVSHVPSAFALAQNTPNPFRPRTTISYQITGESASSVATDLSVYNVNGRRIATLVSGQQVPGSYEAQWDGRDEGGRRVASGVYFYRLQAGTFTAQKRMVLLK